MDLNCQLGNFLQIVLFISIIQHWFAQKHFNSVPYKKIITVLSLKTMIWNFQLFLVEENVFYNTGLLDKSSINPIKNQQLNCTTSITL